MAKRRSDDPDAEGRFVRLNDFDLYIVEDGQPGAPAVLLIHGLAASAAWWDPVVPPLAGSYRVIRVDLLGHGRSASPADGYDIPAHARRIGAALDRLGAGRVTVIGHSTGSKVATALAEQRPDAVAALALIDMGPSPEAAVDQGVLGGLLLAPFPGRLLIFGTDDKRWESRDGCLSVQVLQEFFVNVTRKVAKPLNAEAAKEIVADYSRWYLHVPAADDVLAAIGIHQRTGISFWDAMIIRSAAEIGCAVLYSEDLNAGQEYSGVRVDNPFQPPDAERA